MPVTLGVLITYFNERDLLTECLHSLLSQPQRPDEIMIYDDASTYPSEEYVPKNISVQIIRGNINRGPSYGRNYMLKKSQSDYVHFHDADDLFSPDWYSQIRNKIERAQVDVVFTEVSSYQDGKLVCEKLLKIKKFISNPDLVRFCLQGSILPIATTLRKKLVLELGGYSETLRQAEDFYFHVRLALRNPLWSAIDKPLVFKRNRTGSYSQDSREVWQATLEAIKLLETEIPSIYHADLAETAGRTGSMLFQLGLKLKAREAFKFSKRLGPPIFFCQKRLYRIMASTFGPEVAEELGLLYRRLIPPKWRADLVKREIF